MKHLMIDIETLGTKPGCAIIQIGAVVFDPKEGAVLECHRYNIRPSSNNYFNLKIEVDTMEWWMKQPNRDIFSTCEGAGDDLPGALLKLSGLIESVLPDKIWVKGLSFDIPILEAAYLACSLHIPWKYWECACHRTLLSLCKLKGWTVPDPPPHFTAHDALYDAERQAYDCMAALKYLGCI